MYAYSNNGLSFRAWNDESTILEGEVFFTSIPTTEELEAAFSGYAAAAAVLALQQSAGMMIAAGCQIVSTSDPTDLNGTYAVDLETRSDIQAELVSLSVNGTFTNGTATIGWPDTSGALHSMTAAQFKPFATALGAFYGTLKPIAVAGAGTLPAQPVTIA